MYIRLTSIVLFWLSALHLGAQAEAYGVLSPKTDTVARWHTALTDGRFGARARLMHMSTVNEGMLTDYHGMAAGIHLDYTTLTWRGLRAGVGFSMVKPVFTNAPNKDERTNLNSRYEIGLLDLEHFDTTAAIYRLEQFFLQYRLHKTTFTLGKQVLNTPFVNPQDGRMVPSMQEGFTLTHREKRVQLLGAWLWDMAPRSVFRWLPVEQTFGLVSVGVNRDGSRSGYAGNTHSQGVGIGGITWQPSPRLELQGWNTYVDNVLNNSFLQAEWRRPLREKGAVLLGLQGMYQTSVGAGGNADVGKAYTPPGETAWLLSARVGASRGPWQINLNYTRIGDEGRFLFPREWGREPLYTFILRERNEGLADVHAFTANVNRSINPRWTAGLNYGYYNLPDPADFARNKYAMPSYHHLNAALRYKGRRDNWNGLSVMVLLMTKFSPQLKNDVAEKVIFNKTNLFRGELIVNYELTNKK